MSRDFRGSVGEVVLAVGLLVSRRIRIRAGKAWISNREVRLRPLARRTRVVLEEKVSRCLCQVLLPTSHN